MAPVPQHRVLRTWSDRLRNLIPFGLGSKKPRHYRSMLKAAWKNRDNLPHAWRVLAKGVCDGCALGVAGFHDWTMDGVHLCMTRLDLLRLNTMPELDPRVLENVARLRELDDGRLRDLGRLPGPMIREANAASFRPLSWDDAYACLAPRLREIDPRRLAFYVTSRGVTNEVYYMAQKVARFLGTNNVDNAARICHSPSTAAMKASLGVAATTCSYRDWYGTDLVIFFGSNPANDQPVTTKYLHEAKRLGTRVVLVNPYLEPGMKRYWVPSTPSSAVFGTPITDHWFPVAQGGDIAFLYGVIKVLIAEDWIDHDFVREHVTGFGELKDAANGLEFERLEQLCGLARSFMHAFAELIRDARTAVLVWSMGITQHVFGADAVQMIINLGLLRGYVGRDKCGLMPIRGHSSVQGGAEMGAYATALPGGKPINPENAAVLSAQYGFPVPGAPGLTAAEMVESAHRGNLDLLYCLGGNFLRTLPEPDYIEAAMANTPVRVHQDIILTGQMLIPAREAVLLLPAKTRYEQDDGGTQTSTERRVMFSEEIPRQVGEARAEWKILRELAVCAHPERAHLLGCETGWEMRAEIARIVPLYEGVQNLKQTGDAFQYGGRHLCAGGHFPTPDGRGRLRSVLLPDQAPSNGRFAVSTRRGKQFNTLLFAEVDPINGAARDSILMNADDAAALHLMNRDRVALVNDIGRFEGRVFFAPIARRNLQIHWPEGNRIIPRGFVDRGGGVPDYNATVIVEKL